MEEYYWKNDRGEFFVVEDASGDVVGCAGYCDATAKRGEPSAELKKMHLKPEARGKGVGRALLSKIEEGIRRKGIKNFYLQTVRSLEGGRRLYEAAGYVDTPGITEHPCDRLMKKILD